MAATWRAPPSGLPPKLDPPSRLEYGIQDILGLLGLHRLKHLHLDNQLDIYDKDSPLWLQDSKLSIGDEGSGLGPKYLSLRRLQDSKISDKIQILIGADLSKYDKITYHITCSRVLMHEVSARCASDA